LDCSWLPPPCFQILGVDVSALFDVCHDFPDVGTVFDHRAVNLMVDHGDFVPQGDIVKRLDFGLFLGVHEQSLCCFTRFDVDGGNPDTVGLFVN
jgi:hypothetical protein